MGQDIQDDYLRLLLHGEGGDASPEGGSAIDTGEVLSLLGGDVTAA